MAERNDNCDADFVCFCCEMYGLFDWMLVVRSHAHTHACWVYGLPVLSKMRRLEDAMTIGIASKGNNAYGKMVVCSVRFNPTFDPSASARYYSTFAQLHAELCRDQLISTISIKDGVHHTPHSRERSTLGMLRWGGGGVCLRYYRANTHIYTE